MIESLLMQASNGTSAVSGVSAFTTSIQSLIVAIAAIIGTGAGILHSLSLRPELKNHKAAIQTAADLFKNVNDHIIASKDDMKTLAGVVYDNLPDKGQSIVNATNIRLAELEKKLQVANEQLKKVPGALDHI